SRSASWTQKARRLARRLSTLPLLRTAHISGRVSSSMAALLARVATPDDEATWLVEAERLTVREMTAIIAAASAGVPGSQGFEMEAGSLLASLEAEEPFRTLTVTVPREDAWLFEGTRLLAKHLGERSLADACEALVAEGTSSMLEWVPKEAIVLDDDCDEARREVQRAWDVELHRMRVASEELCESRRAAQKSGSPVALDAATREIDWAARTSVHQLDAQLREMAAGLARRDLEFGERLEVFFCADGWRRLGWATAAHYARERLGVSLSFIKDRRRLARLA